jgi:hypothetical protein
MVVVVNRLNPDEIRRAGVGPGYPGNRVGPAKRTTRLMITNMPGRHARRRNFERCRKNPK